jgi:ferritin-like metal-binding protein YciE
MSDGQQKIVQYLNEAHGMEQALVSVLTSQIAMTPRGEYRSALQSHLRETRQHSKHVQERLSELGEGANPIQFGIGLVQMAVGQALALGKTPLDLLRGTGGEEKVLKNAKDAAATEALEIATYTAIERLARAIGDGETARLAASIRTEEERMLERVLSIVPTLTEAVVGAELDGSPSYRASRTGAADAARSAGRAARRTAKRGASSAKRTARRQTRRATRATSGASASRRSTSRSSSRTSSRSTSGSGSRATKRSSASSGSRSTGRSGSRSTGRAGSRSTGRSGSTASASRRSSAASKRGTTAAQKRAVRPSAATKRARSSSSPRRNAPPSQTPRTPQPRAGEPWTGYERQSVGEIAATLGDASDARVERVRNYEEDHKKRSGVIHAAERELTSA